MQIAVLVKRRQAVEEMEELKLLAFTPAMSNRKRRSSVPEPDRKQALVNILKVIACVAACQSCKLCVAFSFLDNIPCSLLLSGKQVLPAHREAAEVQARSSAGDCDPFRAVSYACERSCRERQAQQRLVRVGSCCERAHR